MANGGNTIITDKDNNGNNHKIDFSQNADNDKGYNTLNIKVNEAAVNTDNKLQKGINVTPSSLSSSSSSSSSSSAIHSVPYTNLSAQSNVDRQSRMSNAQQRSGKDSNMHKDNISS